MIPRRLGLSLAGAVLARAGSLAPLQAARPRSFLLMAYSQLSQADGRAGVDLSHLAKITPALCGDLKDTPIRRIVANYVENWTATRRYGNLHADGCRMGAESLDAILICLIGLVGLAIGGGPGCFSKQVGSCGTCSYRTRGDDAWRCSL
jgi:hypothetical protein